MKTLTSLLASAAVALAIVPIASLSADGGEEQIPQIIDSGMNHSEAMATASELMDGIGPRLTNSEGYDRAAVWALARLREYGLTNVRTESVDFGLGWNLDSWSARMVAPRALDMRMIPVAWSPPTQGTVSAPVILAPMDEEEDFERWRGKLAGKIVLISEPDRASESTAPGFRRFDGGELAEFDRYEFPADDRTPFGSFVKRLAFPQQLSEFLAAEGALAMVRTSIRGNGLVHGEGYAFSPDKRFALPFVELAKEDYNRLARLEIAGTTPSVSIAVVARINETDLTTENLFGDIAGTDPRAGYVLAGGHFDSWHAADGATDDGAGSIVVMEAARILAGLGVRPKRTIRFALWSGEEQGLIGSKAYVDRYIVSRPVDSGLSPLEQFVNWDDYYPITPLPGYSEMKAYFNLDNGAGRIRGVYAENNIDAAPLLRRWLSPFSSMGASTVVTGRTSGTDHQMMAAIGLPAFQFIQDPLDYNSRTHHTSIDTLDHVPPDDIRQAATIMAAMLWQAANSDEELPRLPLPTEPSKSDPFHWEDPEE
ncbi:M20/M25/M40 family metallo-hydrolase [Qipengyuania sp. ASV99]|uniref:M20/M25/M40 family metallo-hydrolase n=1 Tax=Qipengyuania sp. ASV99 TaxID=3399681 RepID=UPI003A4C5E1F